MGWFLGTLHFAISERPGQAIFLFFSKFCVHIFVVKKDKIEKLWATGMLCKKKLPLDFFSKTTIKKCLKFFEIYCKMIIQWFEAQPYSLKGARTKKLSKNSQNAMKNAIFGQSFQSSSSKIGWSSFKPINSYCTMNFRNFDTDMAAKRFLIVEILLFLYFVSWFWS